VAIGGDTLAIHHAVAVLSADGFAQDILIAEGLDGVQNFCLLIADRIGVEGNRRLHGGEADELHHVVGDHVT